MDKFDNVQHRTPVGKRGEKKTCLHCGRVAVLTAERVRPYGLSMPVRYCHDHAQEIMR